jgi:hypothetical protein
VGCHGVLWVLTGSRGYSRGTQLKMCVGCACPRACVCASVCAWVRVGACVCVGVRAYQLAWRFARVRASLRLRASACERVCCSFHCGACVGIVSVSLCVRARASACTSAGLCVVSPFHRQASSHMCAWVCVGVRVCVARLCARASALCRRCVCMATTGGINSSAGGAGGRACVGPLAGSSRALAAGISWVSRTISAPWAARAHHTSVVDAAGAIYVIGGVGGTTYRDMWVSTNGGAR